MKKTIGILLLAVILVFSLTSCGGGGGGSGLSSLISKVTGNTSSDKANKDNFAGKKFNGNAWGSTGPTQFEFGAAGTGTVNVWLEGVNKGACTYNKPTGLSNVTLEIKDSSGTVIFNQVVNFDNEAHSFNTTKKNSTDPVTFDLY